MPVFLIPWLLRLGGVLLVAAFAYACYWKAQHWCNAVCLSLQGDVRELTADVAERDASIALTQKRATDLALLWADQVTKSEHAAHISEASRVQEFGKLADRAKSIGASGVSHFGGVAVGLFDDARRAASGTATGPAPVTPEAAPAPASSAEEFVVAMYEWAATCRARVDEWASFYAALQDASTSIGR